MTASPSTVDPEEIERFSKLADTWWDPHGPMAPLHKINDLRVRWLEKQIINHFPTTHNLQPTTLHGFAVLDIGCGGGLVSEAMAKLGARVTGIDAAEKNIGVARLHAEKSGLTIDYRCTTAEDLLATHNSQLATYDVVLALEIVEHVDDIPLFVKSVCALAKPGGIVIFSTINRTVKSYALAIVGAEYVLRWLPRGTHTWNKFVKPSELVGQLRANNIDVKEMTGMVMNPLTFKWDMNPRDLDVNYLVVGTKL